MNTQTFWGIQATTAKGEKALAYQKRNRFLFAFSDKKNLPVPPPSLFVTKKAAKEAFKNRIPASDAFLKKEFHNIIEDKKTSFVKVHVVLGTNSYGKKSK